MCFEILGFDIILDKKCKPYLLEVNHSPSFNTDTPLDYLVKNDLIYDTMKLLGVSIEEKKLKLQQINEDKLSRLMQKVTLR
jgi:tubulin polyglutamylase TTLL6/13